MFSSLLILLAMPIVDTSRVRGSQFRPLMRWAFWLFVVNFFVLMFIGSQHVEEPFISVGAMSTAFYFAWFLVIVPVIGIVENTLLDIATEPKIQSPSLSTQGWWTWFVNLPYIVNYIQTASTYRLSPWLTWLDSYRHIWLFRIVGLISAIWILVFSHFPSPWLGLIVSIMAFLFDIYIIVTFTNRLYNGLKYMILGDKLS